MSRLSEIDDKLRYSMTFRQSKPSDPVFQVRNPDPSKVGNFVTCVYITRIINKYQNL